MVDLFLKNFRILRSTSAEMDKGEALATLTMPPLAHAQKPPLLKAHPSEKEEEPRRFIPP